MIALIGYSLFYLIIFSSVNKEEDKNYLERIISKFLISISLALASISLLSLIFIFFNIVYVKIFVISFIQLLLIYIFKKNLFSNFKILYINAKKELNNLLYKFNGIDYLILFITLIIYIISIGPINHSDASTAYVGYINLFWFRNSHFIDNGIHQGLLGIFDFGNLVFFQENMTWLIRTIQTLPLLPCIIFLIKNKVNRIFVLAFLCTPVFIQWVTIGKALFFGDVVLATLYLIWNKNKNTENLIYLISICFLNIAGKITGLIIVLPIFIHLFFHYKFRIINFKILYSNKLLFLPLLLSLISLLSICFYRNHITGNPFYPLLSNFFTPENSIFIQFEEKLRGYMRDLFFPVKLFIPLRPNYIGIVFGPFIGLCVLLCFFNKFKNKFNFLKSDFIVGFFQLILLLCLGQGRANYFASPIIIIFSTMNNDAYSLKQYIDQLPFKRIFKFIFSFVLVIQLSFFGLLTLASSMQTVYSLFFYEKAMNIFAFNFGLSEIINQHAIEPYVNLVSIQDRLYSNKKYIDNYNFSFCIDSEPENIYESQFSKCLQKFDLNSFVIDDKSIFSKKIKNYTCNEYEAKIGARNLFNVYKKKVYICSNKK